jgi:hypothetical protein
MNVEAIVLGQRAEDYHEAKIRSPKKITRTQAKAESNGQPNMSLQNFIVGNGNMAGWGGQRSDAAGHPVLRW